MPTSISLFYSYRNNESIRNLTAQTYNLDAAGNITVMKVDKNSIYDKSLTPAFQKKHSAFGCKSRKYH